jgi:uncharacterized membrane protein YgcG
MVLLVNQPGATMAEAPCPPPTAPTTNRPTPPATPRAAATSQTGLLWRDAMRAATTPGRLRIKEGVSGWAAMRAASREYRPSVKLVAMTVFSAPQRSLTPTWAKGDTNKWATLLRGANVATALEEARFWAKYMARSREELIAKGDETAPYIDQGDPALHNRACWNARAALRKHPLVVAELQRWWSMVLESYGLAQDPDVAMRYRDYMDLSVKLYKALIEPFDESDANECARGDWRADCGGSESKLDRVHVMDSLFETADMWTRTIDPSEYATFLRRLFDAVTCGWPPRIRSLRAVSFANESHAEAVSRHHDPLRAADHRGTGGGGSGGVGGGGGGGGGGGSCAGARAGTTGPSVGQQHSASRADAGGGHLNDQRRSTRCGDSADHWRFSEGAGGWGHLSCDLGGYNDGVNSSGSSARVPGVPSALEELAEKKAAKQAIRQCRAHADRMEIEAQDLQETAAFRQRLRTIMSRGPKIAVHSAGPQLLPSRSHMASPRLTPSRKLELMSRPPGTVAPLPPFLPTVDREQPSVMPTMRPSPRSARADGGRGPLQQMKANEEAMRAMRSVFGAGGSPRSINGAGPVVGGGNSGHIRSTGDRMHIYI